MSDIVVQINGAGQRKLNYFGCVGFSYFQDYLLETTVPYVTGLAGILRCPVEERFSTPVLTTCIWEALVDLAWNQLDITSEQNPEDFLEYFWRISAIE